MVPYGEIKSLLCSLWRPQTIGLGMQQKLKNISMNEVCMSWVIHRKEKKWGVNYLFKVHIYSYLKHFLMVVLKIAVWSYYDYDDLCTGPGPGRYALPSTIGFIGHDFTKPTSPAYSFHGRMSDNSGLFSSSYFSWDYLLHFRKCLLSSVRIQWD